MGAAPLSVLRKQLGAPPYWLMGAGMAVFFWGLKMPGMAFLFFLNCVLVGALYELRKTKLGQELQAISAVLVTYIVSIALSLGLSKMGLYDIAGIIMARMSDVLIAFPELAKNIPMGELFNQIPSLGLTYLAVTMAVTLLLEKSFFRMSDEAAPKKELLSSFRLPDSFIWAFILSLLLSFGKFDNPELQSVGVNVLNVTVLAYYFQGLAVVARYFQVFQVGRFWRVFWYILFTVQLFVFTSIIGVVDYWADFRSRFNKTAALLAKDKFKSKLGRRKSRGDS